MSVPGDRGKGEGLAFPRLSISKQELSSHVEDEWIETNGLGAYSSSTILGSNSRRYHGLLVVPREYSLHRDVLLSRLDETIVVGDRSVSFSTRAYRDAVFPDSKDFFESFHQGLFPTLRMRARIDGVGEIVMERSTLMIFEEHTVLLRFFFERVPQGSTLQLEPFVANRSFHALRSSSYAPLEAEYWNGDRLLLEPFDDAPRYGIVTPGFSFQRHHEWYYNFFYARDAERGHGADEDLLNIGLFSRGVESGGTYFVALTTVADEMQSDEEMLSRRFHEEVARRERFAESSQKRGQGRLYFFLERALDSFLIKRRFSQDNHEQRATVVAGYHWFADWGRDAMISLPGISLLPHRRDFLLGIIQCFAEHIRDGLIPNRFSDADGEAEYNSVDASLWFIVNSYSVLDAQKDEEFIREIFLPAALKILKAFEKGTLYSISRVEDGLLWAGGGEDQVTWMDARVGDWVVTPRHGKPVEVNALWVNAYFCIAEIYDRFLLPEISNAYRETARVLKERFFREFWNENVGALFDVVGNDSKDEAIRPNQIIALALPFELLQREHAEQVLSAVRKSLVTPRGLRTLAPNHPSYRGRYEGNIIERDGAYHQGTVWPWLLGPYARAVKRYGTQEMKSELHSILYGFEQELQTGCIGSLAEIFDGDAPHKGRGACSQAWSVAEVLAALRELAAQEDSKAGRRWTSFLFNLIRRTPGQ